MRKISFLQNVLNVNLTCLLTILALLLCYLHSTCTYAQCTINGIRYSIYNHIAEVSSGDEDLTEAIIPSHITYNGTIYPVTSINKFAFEDCENLTKAYIPETVTWIGACPFDHLLLLRDLTVSPNNPRYCSVDNVIYTINRDTIFLVAGGCTGTFAIPNTVSVIGDDAFDCCAGLTEIIIPNSVISIGDEAFQSAASLSEIRLPSSIQKIDDYAFDYLNIQSLYCAATTPPNTTKLTFATEEPEYDLYSRVTLYVPIGCKSAYTVADHWKNFYNIVECDFSNLESATANSVSVSVVDGQIVVIGLTGETVLLYGLNGELIQSVQPNSSVCVLQAPCNCGACIVKVGLKSYKVLL